MRFSSGWWLRHRWRLPQAALLLGGVGLLLIAAAFLLGGSWTEPSANGASAFQSDSTATSTPVPTTASPTPDLASLFAHPFATAVPTATPIPPQPTAPDQPAAPPPGSVPAASTPTPPPPPAPSAPPPAGCPTAAMSGFALDLFNAINGQRAQNGQSPLAADGCVTYVAQLRSNDMATRNYFSHTSPEGTSAFDLLDAYGVPHGWAGENLARNNYPDAESVGVAIRDLMASQGHRDNILSTNYTALGVGYADDGTGMKYYTMVFIGPPL